MPDLAQLDPLVIRTVTIFPIALAAMVAAVIYVEKHPAMPKAKWFWLWVLLIVVLFMLYTISAALFVMATVLPMIGPSIPDNDLARMILIGIAVVGGFWSANILFQLACNIIRPRFGLKRQKLVFIRPSPRKPRKRS
ncbi:MAG TPA: hypothetical protein VG942_03075 [Hyphomonadaceae bacterium]|nr:hypothetical protein [Hyphomonadaceae bacterium]